MLRCFSAVWSPRKARPRSSARGLEKREIVRPDARPGEVGLVRDWNGLFCFAVHLGLVECRWPT